MVFSGTAYLILKQGDLKLKMNWFWTGSLSKTVQKNRFVEKNWTEEKETYQCRVLEGAVESKMWMRKKKSEKLHRKTQSEIPSWSSGEEQEPCGHQEPHTAK